MVITRGYRDAKSYKELLAEFYALRKQIFIENETQEKVITTFEALQQLLLQKLEEMRINAKAEIDKAESKKSYLIKRLVLLEKIKDRYAQDEIIQELEEYSRIRRHREAQMARITKEFADINLTKSEFETRKGTKASLHGSLEDIENVELKH